MKLVAGLGNPGKKYQNTRHNLGFMVIDRLAEYAGIQLDQTKRKCRYGKGRLCGVDLVLLQPQTFMNLSGEAVLYLASFYRIQPEDIIIICDDIALPFGKIRIRASGSHGGHNGLRSVESCLNSSNYPRIRCGVGSPVHPEYSLSSYVLEKFSDEQIPSISALLDFIVEAAALTVTDSVEKAMNEFNGRDLLAH